MDTWSMVSDLPLLPPTVWIRHSLELARLGMLCYVVSACFRETIPVAQYPRDGLLGEQGSVARLIPVAVLTCKCCSRVVSEDVNAAERGVR